MQEYALQSQIYNLTDIPQSQISNLKSQIDWVGGIGVEPIWYRLKAGCITALLTTLKISTEAGGIEPLQLTTLLFSRQVVATEASASMQNF